MEASSNKPTYPKDSTSTAGDVDVGEVIEGEVIGPEGRISAGRVQFIEQAFRGPLPPPEVLGEYDQVIPGLAVLPTDLVNT